MGWELPERQFDTCHIQYAVVRHNFFAGTGVWLVGPLTWSGSGYNQRSNADESEL